MKKIFECLVLILTFSGGLWAQQVSVTGTVTDASGQPLPGVTIIIENTNRGITTDFDGNYSIDVNANDQLIFSSIGFASQTIAVGGQTTIDVILTEGVNVLDEIVVSGYATQSRRTLSGAVGTVEVDDAIKTPVINAADALQGRVAGVQVVTSGAPGASPVVTVRGYATTNSNNPLYVIDGVQTEDANTFNSINPRDIENISVLKDGAAAIYGARASNGVIVITTKGGGYNQKSTLNIESYYGVANVTQLPDMLNVEQHADMIWQSKLNDGTTPSHPQYGSGSRPSIPSVLSVPIPNLVAYEGAQVNVTPGGTDWFGAIFDPASVFNFDLSASGGSESGKYHMSVNYLDREGVMIFSGYERLQTRLNSEFKINDKITVGEHLNVSYSKRNDGVGSAVQNASFSSPLVPLRDSNGNFAGTYSNAAGLGIANSPYADLHRGKDNFGKDLFATGDVYFQWNIMDGLRFKSTAAIKMSQGHYRSFSALNPEHGEAVSTNTLTEGNNISSEWTVNNTLNYTTTFGDSNLDVLLGTEAIKSSYKENEFIRTGYLFEDPEFYTASSGSGTPIVSGKRNAFSLFSLFGTANYVYSGKYFLTATVRSDKTSRFAKSESNAVFPSFSVGWLVSDESFFPESSIINTMKVRASYGLLGNQSLTVSNPDVNISLLDEGITFYPFNGQGSAAPGAALSSQGNPNLTWETMTATNFALDLALFDNKLTASVDIFNNVTKDLIAQDNSALSTTAMDADAPYVNLGGMKSNGFDLSLGYANETDSGFSYSISANVTSAKNKVTELIADSYSGFSSRMGFLTRTEVGQPISSFYGRVVEGIFQNDAEVAAHATQEGAAPGRFKYRDVNEDGVIDDDDRTWIGSPHADFTYGININLAYKNIDFSAFFNGSHGNEIYNYTKLYYEFPLFFNGNRSTAVLDSWSTSNTGARLPALSETIQNNEATQANSYFVEDGSFLRLRSLQIGYTLPERIVSKLGAASARIFYSGSNLFTLTKYTGLDPEFVTFDNDLNAQNTLAIGVYSSNYPVSSVSSLGVSINF